MYTNYMTTPLRYETTAADIYTSLQRIPRTGWVIRGVENPETVYDHTVALVLLADTVAKEIGLSTDETDDLKHILEIHDWAEAIAGDEFVPNEDWNDYAARKKLKAKRERDALEELLQDKPFKEMVEKLFTRYEHKTDEIARLAKELDKYQALELAFQYEAEQGIPLFIEFYEYYKRDWPFSNPVILQRVADLREKHADNIDKK